MELITAMHVILRASTRCIYFIFEVIDVTASHTWCIFYYCFRTPLVLRHPCACLCLYLCLCPCPCVCMCLCSRIFFVVKQNCYEGVPGQSGGGQVRREGGPGTTRCSRVHRVIASGQPLEATRDVCYMLLPV